MHRPPSTTRDHGEGPGCGNNFGYAEPLTWARLEAMYGSYKNYAAKVTQSLDRLVRANWVTPSDAQRIRTELLKIPNPRSRIPKLNPGLN